MKPSITCLHLARLGFAALCGKPTAPDHVENEEPDEEAVEDARLIDHRKVLFALRQKAEKYQFGSGVKWCGLTIDWPDRMPGLVTWSGQQSLAKIIVWHQETLPADEDCDDLYTFQCPFSGATGLDSNCARDPIDVGYSPNHLLEPIPQFPAAELLAIIGLATVPLVSFSRRECGFIDGDTIYRFHVESRSGGYYHRWGQIHPWRRLVRS